MDAREVLGVKFAGWLAMGLDDARCPVRNLLDRVGYRWKDREAEIRAARRGTRTAGHPNVEERAMNADPPTNRSPSDIDRFPGLLSFSSHLFSA